MSKNDFSIQCLIRELKLRIEKNENYSQRAFARDLGLSSGEMSQYLSGKRKLSAKKAESIVEKISLNSTEKQEFLLGGSDKIKKGSSHIKLPSFHFIQEESFKIIAKWYHFAILELTFLKDFQSDPKWISTKLNLDNKTVTQAINRLLQLEYLKRLPSGKLVKTLNYIKTSNRHKTSRAHKSRQLEILEQSKKALNKVPISKRNHSAMTFAIDPTRIPIAKKKIERFMSEMTELLSKGDLTNVYELTVNLFPWDQEFDQ